MTKRKGVGRGPKLGGRSAGANPGNMMAQLQRMQEEMEKAQAELENETLEVTAGGGAISIVITGHQRVIAVSLKPDVVDPEDIDMLQDLLTAAINQAIEESQAMAAKRLEGITGGVNLPGF
jgi:hypothetical protein